MTTVSALNTTYQQSNLPLKFRLLNWAGDRFKLNNLPWFDLTEKSLLTTAQNQTGLSDWGNEDFRTPLKIVLASLNSEANLSLVGRYFFREYFIRLLANRLQLQQDFQRYPEILQVPIEKPLFVIGFFRSGTTFLHNLLSSDPGSRWLHVAEVMSPCPAPKQERWESDPRIEQAKNLLKFQDSLAPNYSTALAIDANRPAECSRLFEYGFIGHQFDFRANVKTYSQWLDRQDLVDAYQYYRQQLQYLSWRWSGSHWLFKAPAHLFAMDALLKVFPDACIVHIHRDPIKAVPSCCSLSAMGRGRFSDRVELTEIGSHWLNLLSRGVERTMQARAGASEDRFFDVNYVDLIKNPIETVRQIYHYFGYTYSDRMEEDVKKWMQANPQHKYGVHRYTLEQFGLTTDQIERKFAKYCERFNVKKEGK